MRRPSEIHGEFLSIGLLRDKYEETDKVLGRGSFALVKACKARATGKELALKHISKFDSHGRQKVDAQALNTEVAICHRLGTHPHILEIFDVYESRNTVSIVLELAPGGTLIDLLPKLGFSEKDAATVVGQVLGALSYLHYNGVVHADIKLENVLLASCEPLHVKLADFGLSRMRAVRQGRPLHKIRHDDILANDARLRFTCSTVAGTLTYMAPELLALIREQARAPAEGATPRTVIDETIDIWATGVMLAELVTGDEPLASQHLEAVAATGGDVRSRKLADVDELVAYFEGGAHVAAICGATFASVSGGCKALLKRMMALDPADRPTAAEALATPWLSTASAAPLEQVVAGFRALQLSRLQVLCLHLIEEFLSSTESDAIHAMFEELDRSRNGTITRDELVHYFDSHPTEAMRFDATADVDVIFSNLDQSGDGSIELDEFRTACLAQRQQLVSSQLRPLFEYIDSDGTGRISAAEVARSCGALAARAGGSLSAEQAQQMLQEHDVSGDGTLDFGEFCLMMTGMMGAHGASGASSTSAARQGAWDGCAPWARDWLSCLQGSLSICNCKASP